MLKIGKQNIYVDPKEIKSKIDSNQEALVAMILLAKNYGRETFKERLKSVKEAYVQRVSEAKESDGKKE